MRITSGKCTVITRVALTAVLMLTMFAALAAPRSSAAERVSRFDTFDTDEPYVALTFDVTFDRGRGDTVLDILAAYNARATFAVTGIWAQQNPDLIERIVNEGHGLMNHTFDHLSLTGDYTGSLNHDKAPPLAAAEVASQLRRTEELIREQTGVDMKPYVRPPYGDYTDETLAALAEAGYTYNIMWTVDTLGWHMRPVEEVTQRALDAARPGANILMHIGHGSTDVDALPGIIEGMRADGYDFATVEEFVEGRLASPDAPHLAPDEGESRARITRYWRENGGLLTFGYPVSPVFEEDDGSYVQFFQRARLEQQPGPHPGEFEVQPAELDARALRELRQSGSFSQLGRHDSARCTTFSEIDFRVCGRLRYRWEDNGGPAVSNEVTARTSD